MTFVDFRHQILDLLILAVYFGLASYRIANMVVGEDGPWFIFDRIRKLLDAGIYNPYVGPDRRWYIGIFECVWCCSVWTSLGFALIYIFIDFQFALYIALPFAVSTVAIVIHEHLSKV